MQIKYILKFLFASLHTQLQNGEPVSESSRASTPQKHTWTWGPILVLEHYSLRRMKVILQRQEHPLWGCLVHLLSDSHPKSVLWPVGWHQSKPSSSNPCPIGLHPLGGSSSYMSGRHWVPGAGTECQGMFQEGLLMPWMGWVSEGSPTISHLLHLDPNKTRVSWAQIFVIFVSKGDRVSDTRVKKKEAKKERQRKRSQQVRDSAIFKEAAPNPGPFPGSASAECSYSLDSPDSHEPKGLPSGHQILACPTQPPALFL